MRLPWLLGHLVGLKNSLIHLFLLALAIQICGIVSPFFMQWVVDHALSSADRDLLLTLTIGFLMLLLIRTSISTMRGWMLMVLGASIKVQGRSNLFAHLVSLPASYFEARHLGDVLSRFDSQETILQAISTDIVEALLDGLMVGITLVVMFVFAPVLAMIVVAGAMLYGVLRTAFYGPLRQASAERIVWGARRDSHFLETLRGVKTIKLFNGQEGRRVHWMNLLIETTNRQLTGQKLRLILRTANSLLMGGLAIVIVWLGARQVMENTLSIGMLLTFISYKGQFLDRVSSLIDTALELRMLGLHAERLADIALTTPEPRDRSVELDRTSLPVSLEVRNLRFRYSDNDPWVLDGVNFHIEPGESVAIVGASGCGKTTLLKLLASLLQPSDGEILVNGQSLSRVGVERYRSMIGVVMQDDQLFAGSIADNICFFSDATDFEPIEQCAKMAAVHDDITDMPMGYNTLIGDMGTVLSGGHKQRVLIARALYFEPSVLLLDEATSHLDIQRESDVNNAVGGMQVTRILVAHRPETIRSAERVIVLEDGRVARDEKKIVNSRVAIPANGTSVAALYSTNSPYWLGPGAESNSNGTSDA